MANALIVVDVQNDFLPGGSLAVPGGDQIVPVINRLMEKFAPDHVFFTKDSHPKNHGSFASNHVDGQPFTLGILGDRPQMLWPDHCVQGTSGEKLSADLEVPEDAEIVVKGRDAKFDSYSGFRDDGGAETTLNELLVDRGIDTVYVCGLATDYCVKATAFDAEGLNYDVRVVIDACRGVTQGTVEQALAEMDNANIKFVKSDDLDMAVKPFD